VKIIKKSPLLLRIKGLSYSILQMRLLMKILKWFIIIFFALSMARGQDVEIVPFRLVPSLDPYGHIKVEIVEPVAFLSVPDVYKAEILEILIDRAVFEMTNPFAVNEPFQVDDKFYHLVKIPNTGGDWHQPYWRHAE
tara:strand:+ start:5803 stop:6213 length:411 start_codon:yes stop_codon:yes gene_type:complete